MIERIPPQNTELEQSLLASIILSPDDNVFESLSPLDFYKTAHQKTYSAILTLHNCNEPIDLATIAEYLTSHKQIDACGGAQYISKLIEFPITNQQNACNKIKAYAQLRRMIEISNSITKRCFNAPPEEVENVLDYAQTEMLKVGIQSNASFKPIQDIMVECIERCEDLQERGGITGVPTGFKDLDALTCGLQPGDLILLAGRPSMGKTSFQDNCLLNAAEQGFIGASCQLEMTSTQQGNRFLASKGKINSLKFRSGKFSGDDWFSIQNAAAELSTYKIYVDDNPVSHYKDIQKKARFAKKNLNIDALWIDYLGFIDGDKAHSKVDEIQSISRGLKSLAKELSVPVILLCQLSRSCEQRPNKRPILSDLRDSGALEQDADVVLFIYRDEVYNDDSQSKGIAEINIAKQRNGPTGTIRLAWLKQFTRFEDLAHGDFNNQ